MKERELEEASNTPPPAQTKQEISNASLLRNPSKVIVLRVSHFTSSFRCICRQLFWVAATFHFCPVFLEFCIMYSSALSPRGCYQISCSVAVSALLKVFNVAVDVRWISNKHVASLVTLVIALSSQRQKASFHPQLLWEPDTSATVRHFGTETHRYHKIGAVV